MNAPEADRNNEPSWLQQRKQMVLRQLESRGLRDRRVLQAMMQIPREEFVPTDLQEQAFQDGPLPIGFGQTISQPYTVAAMAEALRLSPSDRVLDVGTGSGYAAAVLSCLAAEVHSIERIPELAESASQRLRRLGMDNVHVHLGDGTAGLPAYAPFDAIVVTAGAPELPQPYVEQLADGGRIVIPIGSTSTSQSLYRFTRHGDHIQSEDLGPFSFVPLIGKHGWPDDDLS